MNRTDFTDLEWIALEMAELGAVSGRLTEWPMLRRAFVTAGLELNPKEIDRVEMMTLARGVLEAVANKNA